jgi:hypothetical protein
VLGWVSVKACAAPAQPTPANKSPVAKAADRIALALPLVRRFGEIFAPSL